MKGDTGSSVTPGLRGVRVSFPWRLGKKSVYAMALIHSWKELLITAKLAVFNKYFALCLQKGRGCPRFAVTTQFSDKVKRWLLVGTWHSWFTGVLKELM